MKSPKLSSVVVRVLRLKHGADLPLPEYQSEGAAGLDLLAAVETPVELPPRARDLIPTGLILSLPAGYEAQVRPRSGLALKHGLTVLNSPGTIDSDYRGEVKVLLVNHGNEPFTIRRGERIAQLVIAPVTRAELEVSAVPLDATRRGSGGFGSTGTVPVAKSKKPRTKPSKEKTVPGRRKTAQQKRRQPVKPR